MKYKLPPYYNSFGCAYVRFLRYKLPPYYNTRTVMHQDGDTMDIVNDMCVVFNECAGEYKEYAKNFSRASVRATCKAIFNYLVANVNYIADGFREQLIKTPSALIHEATGDCKSYSIFTAVMLENLGIPYIFRFVGYHDDNEDYEHVYIVAKDEDGNDLPVDCVAYIQKGTPFGAEYEYKHKLDKTMTKISMVAGVDSFFVEEINANEPVSVKMLKSLINRTNAEYIYEHNEQSVKDLALYRVALRILQSTDGDTAELCAYPLAVAYADGSITADSAYDNIISASQDERTISISDTAEVANLMNWWRDILNHNYNVTPKTDDNINDFFRQNSAALFPYFYAPENTRVYEQAKIYIDALADVFAAPFCVIENETYCGLVNNIVSNSIYPNIAGDTQTFTNLQELKNITSQPATSNKNLTVLGSKQAKIEQKTYNATNTINQISQAASGFGDALKNVLGIFEIVGKGVKDIFTGGRSYSADAAKLKQMTDELNEGTDKLNKTTTTVAIVGGLAIAGILAFMLMGKKGRR